MQSLILSAKDLATLVRRVGLDTLFDDVVSALHDACSSFTPERYTVAVREGFYYREPEVGLLEWMPTLEAGRSATLKVVSYHPHNAQSHGLPTILSTLLAFDPRSGHLCGLVDGTFATALRTAAASVVASRILAPPDARSIGFIGCGAQALAHLHGLRRSFDLDTVYLFDTEPTTSASFAARARGLGLDGLSFVPVSAAQVLAAADILVTATSVAIDAEPVVSDGVHRGSLHINAVGSDFPGKCELPLSLLKRALVCPDVVEQAQKEGECQRLTNAEIGPDLVQLVQSADRYRDARSRLTVFDSTGWGLEDHVTLKILLAYAGELGIGTPTTIETSAADPRNPYCFVHDANAAIIPDARLRAIDAG